MAALIKALQEFADTSTSETPAQLAEQAADATLPVFAGVLCPMPSRISGALSLF